MEKNVFFLIPPKTSDKHWQNPAVQNWNTKFSTFVWTSTFYSCAHQLTSDNFIKFLKQTKCVRKNILVPAFWISSNKCCWLPKNKKNKKLTAFVKSESSPRWNFSSLSNDSSHWMWPLMSHHLVLLLLPLLLLLASTKFKTWTLAANRKGAEPGAAARRRPTQLNRASGWQHRWCTHVSHKRRRYDPGGCARTHTHPHKRSQRTN